MPNAAAAEKSSSAEHGDGGPARHPPHLAPHPKAEPAPLGAGPAICFPPRILDAKSPGSADLTPLHGESRLHATRETRPDRIRELEDALKEAERRVAEMRAERDQAFELVEQMKEHVSDVDALIDSWIEAFEMQLSEDGKRTRDALPESIKKILADAVALQKQAKGLGKK